MSWFWKTLILLSLAMNLAGFGAQIEIVDRALTELWSQVGVLQGISSDQQALRRQVIALEEFCGAERLNR
jgi:hypothetical protein